METCRYTSSRSYSEQQEGGSGLVDILHTATRERFQWPVRENWRASELFLCVVEQEKSPLPQGT